MMFTTVANPNQTINFERPDVASGHCLVCGNAVDPWNQVFCTKCATLHHRDCFEYNGHCAVYACGGAMATAIPAPSPEVTPVEARPQVPAVLTSFEATGVLRTFGIAMKKLARRFNGEAVDLGFRRNHLPSPDPAVSFQADLEYLVSLPVRLVFFFLFGMILPGLVAMPGILLCDIHTRCWTYDSSRNWLICTTYLLGLRVGRQNYPREFVRSFHLKSYHAGSLSYLVATLHDDQVIWITDDRQVWWTGHSKEDLVALGAQLAGRMGVAFEQEV